VPARAPFFRDFRHLRALLRKVKLTMIHCVGNPVDFVYHQYKITKMSVRNEAKGRYDINLVVLVIYDGKDPVDGLTIPQSLDLLILFILIIKASGTSITKL
jgi:hypothetical protein